MSVSHDKVLCVRNSNEVLTALADVMRYFSFAYVDAKWTEEIQANISQADCFIAIISEAWNFRDELQLAVNKVGDEKNKLSRENRLVRAGLDYFCVYRCVENAELVQGVACKHLFIIENKERGGDFGEAYAQGSFATGRSVERLIETGWTIGDDVDRLRCPIFVTLPQLADISGRRYPYVTKNPKTFDCTPSCGASSSLRAEGDIAEASLSEAGKKSAASKLPASSQERLAKLGSRSSWILSLSDGGSSERPVDGNIESSSGISMEKLAALYRGYGRLTDLWLPNLTDNLIEADFKYPLDFWSAGNEGEDSSVSPRKVASIFHGKAQASGDRLKSQDEIEAMAMSLRECLAIEGVLNPDLLSLIDGLQGIFDGFEIKVSDKRLVGVEVYADNKSNVITFEKQVYESLLQREPRARMTFAHEVGHIALNHPGVGCRTGVTGIHKWINSGPREEWEASLFARAFLAPKNVVANCSTPGQLRKKCGISWQAALARFEEVKRFSGAQQKHSSRAVIDFLSMFQNKER